MMLFEYKDHLLLLSSKVSVTGATVNANFLYLRISTHCFFPLLNNTHLGFENLG